MGDDAIPRSCVSACPRFPAPLPRGGPDFDAHRLAAALPAFGEPFAQRKCESVRDHAKSSFEQTIGKWKRVIKFGRPGKIAHAKRVEPVERTKPPLAAHDKLHRESLRVHL